MKKPWVLSYPLIASEDSDQTGRMPKLIWVYAGRTLILLFLSCGSDGSGWCWNKTLCWCSCREIKDTEYKRHTETFRRIQINWDAGQGNGVLDFNPWLQLQYYATTVTTKWIKQISWRERSSKMLTVSWGYYHQQLEMEYTLAIFGLKLIGPLTSWYVYTRVHKM